MRETGREKIVNRGLRHILWQCVAMLFLFLLFFPSQLPAVDIGVILAKSGPATDSNQPTLESIRFAVWEVNEKGGIRGEKINLIEFDNLSTLIGSKVAADQAVEAGVAAVIGATWSSHSLAAAPVLQQAKIPMISPLSTDPKVTLVGDYIFRVCFTDSFQGHVLAKFARETLKAKDAVVLKDVNSAYSLTLSRSFIDSFTLLGGKIISEIPYKRSDDSYQPLFQAIREAAPSLVFIPGHSESGAIASRLKENNIKAIPLGGDGWGGKGFYAMGGDQIKEGYFATNWSAKDTSARSRAYVQRSNAAGIDLPNAMGYDAASLLMDALGRAESFSGKDTRAALADTRDFPGISGTITFNNQGDPEKDVHIMAIRNGQEEFLQTVHP